MFFFLILTKCYFVCRCADCIFCYYWNAAVHDCSQRYITCRNIQGKKICPYFMHHNLIIFHLFNMCCCILYALIILQKKCYLKFYYINVDVYYMIYLYFFCFMYYLNQCSVILKIINMCLKRIFILKYRRKTNIKNSYIYQFQAFQFSK